MLETIFIGDGNVTVEINKEEITFSDGEHTMTAKEFFSGEKSMEEIEANIKEFTFNLPIEETEDRLLELFKQLQELLVKEFKLIKGFHALPKEFVSLRPFYKKHILAIYNVDTIVAMLTFIAMHVDDKRVNIARHIDMRQIEKLTLDVEMLLNEYYSKWGGM